MSSVKSKSNESNGASASAASTEQKPKLRPCCACPETKKLRDECIIERGEEHCESWALKFDGLSCQDIQRRKPESFHVQPVDWSIQ
ncbi:hypothetical protein RRG08_017208 [Elysia crispata]|uniref:Uncharacterized protein n=1 Tax=Elysia crispata TaxID=231223 RepID=A0AAE1DNH7_9GAST|nr:hypothetical protein RRG08_017208 [Elysia crispata]